MGSMDITLRWSTCDDKPYLKKQQQNKYKKNHVMSTCEEAATRFRPPSS